MTKAQHALSAYLHAGQQIDTALEHIHTLEADQATALTQLVDVVGPKQAAELAGVTDKAVRAALTATRPAAAGVTRRRTRTPPAAADSQTAPS